MTKVEIYTQPFCGYCSRAKRLLDGKGVAYDEIDVMSEPARRREMVERADGRTSTPQIFIDGKCIGGSDELAALERKGELDGLLAGGSGAA
jgi:glutaredoxin 3